MSWPRLAFALGLAAVIAFVLPTTGHGDFFISNFNSTLIFTDHPNFYHALADEPTAVFPTGLSGGPYGPLFYYPTAAWLFVLDSVQLIDIQGWTGPSDETVHSLLNVLLLKLPNLASYVLVAIVLRKTLAGERGEVAGSLWLANPAVILFSLMMGQNDGWASLTSVVALFLALCALQNRPLRFVGARWQVASLAMVVLAAGAAVKLLPILLVPPFAWVLGRDYREKGLLAVVGAVAFVLLITPFLGTGYFWEHGLFGRQAGQTPDLPLPVTAVLYGCYLALVMFIAKQDANRVRVLLFSLLALYALIYLLPGLAPQRAVLFLAALSLAVPIRRAFLLPYLFVTAFGLVLALEHRNEIASDLFEPLTARVLLVPPLSQTGEIEPLRTVLFAVTGAAWAAALASLWWTTPVALRSIRWSPFVVPLLAAGLLLYIAVSFSRLPSGVDATPYTVAAAPQRVDAGQTFRLFFVSGENDLRAIVLRLEGGGVPAQIDIADANGRLLYAKAAQMLVPGENRFELERIEDARGMWFSVGIRPREPIIVAMVEVPRALAAASVQLDGRPLLGSAIYTLHHETTWSALLGDAASQLRRSWLVMVTSSTVSVAALGLSYFGRREATSDNSRLI